jgi:hypothetical protein
MDWSTTVSDKEYSCYIQWFENYFPNRDLDMAILPTQGTPDEVKVDCSVVPSVFYSPSEWLGWEKAATQEEVNKYMEYVHGTSRETPNQLYFEVLSAVDELTSRPPGDLLDPEPDCQVFKIILGEYKDFKEKQSPTPLQDIPRVPRSPPSPYKVPDDFVWWYTHVP